MRSLQPPDILLDYITSLLTLASGYSFCPLLMPVSEAAVLHREEPLEEGMATHSSVVAWRIPGTGEPGGLPPMGSHRVVD